MSDDRDDGVLREVRETVMSKTYILARPRE
jgi:hypothetical protein